MQSPSPPARTAAGYPVKLDDDQRLLHGLTCIRPSARPPLADRLKQARLSIQLDKRLALLVDANPLHAGLPAVKMTPRQADGHGVTHAPPPRAGRPALRSMSMAHCRSDNLSRRCSEPTVTAMWVDIVRNELHGHVHGMRPPWFSRSRPTGVQGSFGLVGHGDRHLEDRHGRPTRESEW